MLHCLETVAYMQNRLFFGFLFLCKNLKSPTPTKVASQKSHFFITEYMQKWYRFDTGMVDGCITLAQRVIMIPSFLVSFVCILVRHKGLSWALHFCDISALGNFCEKLGFLLTKGAADGKGEVNLGGRGVTSTVHSFKLPYLYNPRGQKRTVPLYT